MTESLGTRIRLARERYGMGQSELARRIGISKQSLYQIEHDKTPDPGALKIKAIAEVLGVSTDELLRGVPAQATAVAERTPVVTVGREHLHPTPSKDTEGKLNLLAHLKSIMEDELLIEVIRSDVFDAATKEDVIRHLMAAYEHIKGVYFGNS